MNVVVVHCSCGDAVQASTETTTAAQKMMRLVRHFRCSNANTASMIGMVTSAVRDTTTNIMLASRLSAIAASSAASRILPACSAIMIG